MLRIIRTAVLGVAAIALSSLSPVQAALFRGTFEGFVTGGLENPADEALQGLGGPKVEGVFRYDTRLAPPNTANGDDSGLYEFWGTPTWLTMRVDIDGDSYSFEDSPAERSIYIESDRDGYHMVAENGLLEYRDNKRFQDSSKATVTLIDQFTDPIDNPTLNQDWSWSAGDGPINSGRNARGEVHVNSSVFNFEFDDFDEQTHRDITFDVTRLSIHPVPLPAALPLFGAALVGLGALAARRRRTIPHRSALPRGD